MKRALHQPSRPPFKLPEWADNLLTILSILTMVGTLALLIFAAWWLSHPLVVKAPVPVITVVATLAPPAPSTPAPSTPAPKPSPSPSRR